MYGKYILRLCSISLALVHIFLNSPISYSSLTVSLSMTRSPNGVVHLACFESAKPGRYRTGEGPALNSNLRTYKSENSVPASS